MACVIVNRFKARQGALSLSQICQAPARFSCWTEGDPNRQLLLRGTPSDVEFEIARKIATEAKAGTLGLHVRRPPLPREVDRAAEMGARALAMPAPTRACLLQQSGYRRGDPVDSRLIEVAIGLALTFALISLLATAVMEGISYDPE